MAAARNQQKPLGPILIPLSIAIAALLIWNGWPGLVLIWVGLLISAFTYPSPPMSRVPTPAEEHALVKYRYWSGLKTALLLPGKNWLPSWPIHYTWMLAVAAGLVALALPVEKENGHWLNALAAFVVVSQLAAVHRDTMISDDTCPGTRTSDLISLIRQKPRSVLVPGIAALVLGTVAAFIAVPYIPERGWGLVCGTILAIPLLATFVQAKHEAIDHWKMVVSQRARWKERWKLVKMDPGPRLLDRKFIGDPANPTVIIDTFRAASTGSAQMLTMSDKIVPLLEGQYRVAVASVPSEDQQGQPMPGTVSSVKFEVIQFPSDAVPDPADSSTTPEVMNELVRSAFAWMGEQAGMSPGFTSIDLVCTDDSPTRAWAISINGIGAKSARSQQLGIISALFGAGALLDHRGNGGQGVLFVGDLFGCQLDPQTGLTKGVLENLVTEDTWTARWNELIKQGDNPPMPQFPTANKQSLANGVEIEQLAFVTLNGMPPAQFFLVENKFATVLNGAPFASLAGWHETSGPRKGERHAQAFVARWSSSAVPSRPDDLAPKPGSQAPDWVLAALLNAGFKAGKLAGRPELISATALTKPSSRAHIWKMHVRLYDGVTLSDVRTQARRIKETWASAWLRVAEAPDGCYIYAGAQQSKVDLKSPSVAKEIDALDWEQVFIDSKISGLGGSMPKLVSTEHLEQNQQVKKLRFDLAGTGLVFATFKGERARLESNSGNAFVEPREVRNKPQEIDLMVCEIDPMPERSDYDWAFIDEAKGIPFATGVEGEPIQFNFRNEIHLLCAGASGGGKSVLLQSLIYGALVRGYEIYIADPTKGGADFQFAAPYAKAIIGEVFEAAAMMKTVYAEVVRRKNMNAQHGVGNYLDLPEEIRPKHMMLVLDEFTSLMQPDPLPTKSDDPELQSEYEAAVALNKAKIEVGIYTGKIAREARSAGVTLLLATQKLSAKLLDSIPGASDLKVNLSRLLLGKATFGDKQSALKNAMEAPVLGTTIPAGRGLFETSGNPTAIIQAWYNPAEQTILAQKLAERLDPLNEADRLDVSAFRSAPVDTGPAVVDYVLPDPEQVVELDEIDLSAFADLFTNDEDEDEVIKGELETEQEPARETLDEPSEMRGPLLLLGIDGCVAPFHSREGLWTLPAGKSMGRGTFLYDPQAIAILDDAEFDKAFITDWGPDAIEAWGSMMEVTSSVEGVSEVHGWWKIDAALAYVREHPTERVVWVDDLLSQFDERLGMTYGDQATILFSEIGVKLICVSPDGNYGLDAESAELVVFALQGHVDQVNLRSHSMVQEPQSVSTVEDDLALPELPELEVVPVIEILDLPELPALPEITEEPAPVPKKRRSNRKAEDDFFEAAVIDHFDDGGFQPWPEDVSPRQRQESREKKFEDPPKRGRRSKF